MTNAAPDLSSLYAGLQDAFAEAGADQDSLSQLIVEAPFAFEREAGLLFLGFISYFLVDEAGQALQLIGVTDNDYYRQSVQGYPFAVKEYIVPLTATDNSLIQALHEGKPVVSTNWESLRREDAPEGVARLNQASGGIGYSVAYPLTGKTQGALLFNYFGLPENIGEPQDDFMARYAKLVERALARLAEPVAS